MSMLCTLACPRNFQRYSAWGQILCSSLVGYETAAKMYFEIIPKAKRAALFVR
jgi:hypothetical protein